MEKNKTPIRICSSCGLKKPLSAFIQVSGPEGRRYGNICATCRGQMEKEKDASSPFDESSTLELRLRIGAKERVQGEKEQKRQLTIQRDSHREEVKKREALSIERVQQTDKQNSADKDRRKIYLEAKKTPGFLSKRSTTTSLPPKNLKAEPQLIERSSSTALSEREQAVETLNQVENNTQESRRTGPIDLSISFVDSQLGELKYHSQAFLQFIYSSGASGPIRRTMEQLFGKKPPTAQPPAAQKDSLPEKNEKETKKSEKSTISEYINQTWNPTSRRR